MDDTQIPVETDPTDPTDPAALEPDVVDDTEPTHAWPAAAPETAGDVHATLTADTPEPDTPAPADEAGNAVEGLTAPLIEAETAEPAPIDAGPPAENAPTAEPETITEPQNAPIELSDREARAEAALIPPANVEQPVKVYRDADDPASRPNTGPDHGAEATAGIFDTSGR